MAKGSNVYVEVCIELDCCEIKLVRRGIQTSLVCPTCDEVETREHMMIGCGWTRRVWLGALGVNVDKQDPVPIELWLSSMASSRRGNMLED